MSYYTCNEICDVNGAICLLGAQLMVCTVDIILAEWTLARRAKEKYVEWKISNKNTTIWKTGAPHFATHCLNLVSCMLFLSFVLWKQSEILVTDPLPHAPLRLQTYWHYFFAWEAFTSIRICAVSVVLSFAVGSCNIMFGVLSMFESLTSTRHYSKNHCCWKSFARIWFTYTMGQKSLNLKQVTCAWQIVSVVTVLVQHFETFANNWG